MLGGAEVGLLGLLRTIDRGEWEPVALLGQRGPLVDKLTADGVPVTVLEMPANLRAGKQGEFGIRTILNPSKIAGSLTYVARLAARLRRDRVVLVHANSLRACVLSGFAGRVAGVPVVWHIHSVIGSPVMSSMGLKLLRFLARFLPSHIICNSRISAEDFRVAKHRVTVVPCGVDSQRFAPNGSRPHSHPRIGMIARFAPLKGQHVFVHAAHEVSRRYPKAEFVLAGTALFGEEGYELEVRKMVVSGKNRPVQFLGFVDDVPELLHGLDVVVSPSTQPEGFGQAIVEAMMTGKPVIASALGGPVDVVQDGITGRLVPAGDVAALARAIEDMLADPEGAASMGRRGRERALDLYDIRESTRRVEDIYEKVLSGN